MTRRGFIATLIAGFCSRVCNAVGWASPTDSLGIYPGKVVPMGDIQTESKWSG